MVIGLRVNSHSEMSTEDKEADFGTVSKQSFEKVTKKIANVSKIYTSLTFVQNNNHLLSRKSCEIEAPSRSRCDTFKLQMRFLFMSSIL